MVTLRKENSMSFRESNIKALTDMGMNNLEANVYLALLKEPGTTGYRVAKTIGKAVSNVYQSLESLTRKGVVILMCEGKDRLYSPVPVKEVIARFKTDLDEKSRTLEHELKNLNAQPPESAIYRIENKDQLFNKVRTLITEAKSAILLTADGFFIEQLKTDLEQAGKNGKKVLVLGYEELELENCEFLHLKVGSNSPWPGHWIIMDVDGVQHLIAFFENPDTLTHAIWCDDQYVSYWIHFFMMADFSLMMFFQETKDKPEYKEIHDMIHGIYRKYSHYNLNLAEHYTNFTWLKKTGACKSDTPKT